MTKQEIQDTALLETDKYRRSGVGITMGGGKTLLGLRHMDKIYQANKDATFLVVAPKLSIFKSWEEDAIKFKLEHLIDCITYTTYKSLGKQSLNHACVYLDECHSLLYTYDFWLSQYGGMILGLTGTPPRFRKSEKGEMVQKFCPIVFTYITDDAVDDGILNDYRIIIHHLHLNQAKTVPMVNKTTGSIWYQSEQNSYEYWNGKLTGAEISIGLNQENIKRLDEELRHNPLNPKLVGQKNDAQRLITQQLGSLPQLRIMRMKALMGFPTKTKYSTWMLTNSKNKTIVFANTQEQAEKICEYSYHAKNKDSERNLEMFKAGEITCLSSVMQLNEGVNIPDLREGIILHAYSNERKSAQRLGRLLRLNPGDVALLHILCFDQTVDEKWVTEALKDFDQEKITHFYPTEDKMYSNYGEEIDSITMPWGEYTPPANYIKSLTNAL